MVLTRRETAARGRYKRRSPVDRHRSPSAAWLLFGAFLSLSTSSVVAAPTDYRFDPLPASVQRGMGVTVEVRVVNIQTGQPVPDVEISDPRFDRSPDGMPGATSPTFLVPGLDYGAYKFRTSFPTAGQWALTFQAKISGESSPIYASVVFQVVDPRPGPSLPGPQGPSRAPSGATTGQGPVS